MSNLLPSYSVFNQFWFLKRIFLYVIIKGLWSCYLRMAFRDGDNFCKAFAGALVNMSYHSWLRHSWYDKFTCAPAKALQKLSPSRKTTFSNSGINKVAMVKNALLPMSLYSLLCVNEIIRYHLHIVDRSTMCKWNHKVSFTHSRQIYYV